MHLLGDIRFTVCDICTQKKNYKKDMKKFVSFVSEFKTQ